MFRKSLVSIFCTIFVMCVLFYFGQVVTAHEGTPHDSLSASADFLWGYRLYPNPFIVTWYVFAKVSAPSNADGEYSVYTWVEGGQEDGSQAFYLGGTSSYVFFPNFGEVLVDYVGAKSTVERDVFAGAPAHRKGAWITGSFLLGSPRIPLQHTHDPEDHFTSSDR